MKNAKKFSVKELAKEFDEEFNSILAVKVLNDNNLVYKKFLIKQISSSDWRLIELDTKTCISEFFLKSSAILAANAYEFQHYGKYHYIKYLDRRYRANHNDFTIFKNNVKLSTTDDQREILYNRLVESEIKLSQCRHQITTMFKRIFV